MPVHQMQKAGALIKGSNFTLFFFLSKVLWLPFALVTGGVRDHEK